MNNQNRHELRFRCKSHPVMRIALHLTTLLMFFTTPLFTASCDSKNATVDMKRVSTDASKTVVNDPRDTLRIAVAAMISPETTRTYYEELLRVIADRAGRRAVFSQRRTYAEVNTLLKNREVDLAFVCSGPYTQGHDEFGMEILAVPVVHGVKVYHSYIIARRGSKHEKLGDLRGHKFAFTDPQSNTGCLVPTYMLARKGERPETFFRETFYSRSHDNSIKAVADGQADGAAVDSLIWEFINTINPSLTSGTKIIEKSPPYGIPPVVAHPQIDPVLKKKLKKIFLTLHQDKEAAPLMAKIQIERFAEGDDAMYETVREMSRWLNSNKSK